MDAFWKKGGLTINNITIICEAKIHPSRVVDDKGILQKTIARKLVEVTIVIIFHYLAFSYSLRTISLHDPFITPQRKCRFLRYY